MQKEKASFGLNADVLKFIAIIAMTLDHMAWAFVDVNTVKGFWMHFVGRLTIPIMSLFIAEGYAHTKNLEKYISRLAIFAVISQIPFSYFKCGNMWYNQLNVIFSLLFAILAVYIYDSKKIQGNITKVILIVALCMVSMRADWFFAPILWALAMFVFKENRWKRVFAFLAVTAFVEIYYVGRKAILIGDLSKSLTDTKFMLGLFAAAILIALYNGKRGSTSSVTKWFFYIYYPLHLLLIGFCLFNL